MGCDISEQSPAELLAQYRRECLEACQGRAFVRRTFTSYPSLRSIEPQAWDDDRDEVGYLISARYIGQPFDPDKVELVEGGWDHEHCYVCNARIEPGDEHWQSSVPWPLELCPACYERLPAGAAEPDGAPDRGGEE